MGAELDGEYTPVKAGLARPKVKAADFIGKEAYLAARAAEPAAVLVHADVEDHVSPRDGIARYMTGASRSHGRRRSASSMRRDGRRSSRRPARARRSASSSCSRTSRPSMRRRYRAARPVHERGLSRCRSRCAGSRPLFDPDDARMKG
jgi:hypothetical protein